MAEVRDSDCGGGCGGQCGGECEPASPRPSGKGKWETTGNLRLMGAERATAVPTHDVQGGVFATLLPVLACKITGRPVMDPTLAEDGYTYERVAIEGFIREELIAGALYVARRGRSTRFASQMSTLPTCRRPAFAIASDVSSNGRGVLSKHSAG